MFEDAAFWLTVGSFLLTVGFLLAVVFGSFFAYSLSFFTYTLGVLLTVELLCSQKESVSKKQFNGLQAKKLNGKCN